MTRQRRLEQTVAVVKMRFGPTAIKKASSAPQAPVLPTGFSALDKALGGGLPLGKCHELVGYGTAGQVTVAAGILAEAQRRNRAVAYVDLGASIDLELLARRGVRLGTLAVLRPDSFRQALRMVGDLLRANVSVAATFDRLQLPAPAAATHNLQAALREWVALLDRSESMVILLTELLAPAARPSDLPLANLAHIRLLFEHRQWLYRGRQIAGFCTAVTILKNKGGKAGQQFLLRVRL